MDRRTLDKLYVGSRGKPARLFMRGASECPMEASTYRFLLDHVGELDADALITILSAQLAAGFEVSERPFVRRLAELIPSSGISCVLRVLRLSDKISAEAWIEDITLPLKGKIERYQWYRFVDKARGGELFNALNVGMPKAVAHAGWNQDEMVVPSIEQQRPEPLVVPLLERAHDDFAAAQFALKTQSVPSLLRLGERFPELITAEAIERELPSRVASTSEPWVSESNSDPQTLPTWMAPFVVQRLRHCGDAEARVLYEWLIRVPQGLHDSDPYKLAIDRFAQLVSGPPDGLAQVDWWVQRIGRHLSTGAAWKTRGQEFVSLCIDLGKGFPPQALRAALAAAGEQDGAKAEHHRQSILRKVHDVTAKLLVERAEAALIAGDFDSGDLFLSAFLSLDPGSYIGGAVHHLTKIRDVPPEITARIDACAELTGAGGRKPTEDAFLEAFLVLTRQVS